MPGVRKQKSVELAQAGQAVVYMTERSDGVTDARIQAAKVIAGFSQLFSQGSPARADGIAAMSPERREGVFDAIGWAGDRARAWDVPALQGQ